MNDNESKKEAVKKFIIEHKSELIIAAFSLTLPLLSCTLCYYAGRIDQYNNDARSFGKQLVRAANILDGDTKIAFVNAFDGV